MSVIYSEGIFLDPVRSKIKVFSKNNRGDTFLDYFFVKIVPPLP